MRNMDFDKWIPKEEDRPRLVAYFEEYRSTMEETCGKDDDQTEEARILLETVKTVPLNQCKGEIQEHFASMVDAVNGEVERYYENWPETLALITMIVHPET